MSDPITIVLDPPLPSDAPDVFEAKAFAAWAGLAQALPQINAAANTINAAIDGVGDDAAAAAASAQAAAGHASNASQRAQDASTSAQTATTKASEAAQSATAAQTHAQTATTKATEADQSAQAASASATSAGASSSTAEAAAGNAQSSAQAADQSATLAQNHAQTATTKATEAAQSAQAASTAQGHAQTASARATEAVQAASTAQTHAQTATTKANEAAQSAQAAAQSAQDALNAAQGEPTIAPGTTAQYWRGDKTWRTLNKSAVGLGNADNTSDADKPVSTAQQAAINNREPKINKSNGYARWTGSVWTFDNKVFLDVSHAANNVTHQKMVNWDTAHGWGNHANAGYLKTDAVGTTVQGFHPNLAAWANKAVPNADVVDTTAYQTLYNKSVNRLQVDAYIYGKQEGVRPIPSLPEGLMLNPWFGMQQRVVLTRNLSVWVDSGDACVFDVVFQQDAIGGRTVTFDPNIRFVGAGATASNVNTQPHGLTWVTFYCPGTSQGGLASIAYAHVKRIGVA